MSKLYHGIINICEKFVPEKLQPLWKHPAGPKTVFFWAPAFKWVLVIAGFSDMINRPIELLSVKQCFVLACTGLIWARYSFVIVPKNYSLFSVNFFLGTLNCGQTFRAFRYQQSLLDKDKK